MDIKELCRRTKEEKRAYKYLAKSCWKNSVKFCIRCKSRKLYKLKNNRYRCKKCKYTFSDFTGRWISRINLSCVDILWLLKLFELEVSSMKISHQLHISYSSALHATTLIRRSLLSAKDNRLLYGKVEMDEAYFGGKRKGKRGRGAKNKIPVFGILERDGKVRVEIVPDVSADTLVNATLKKVKRGSIVYTDKWKSYDSLMFCGYRHLNVDHKKTFVHGKVYINGIEGFWSYAKERLIKYHGVSKEKFPLYIKEMEYKYNHRNYNLYRLLVKNITKLVSKGL